MDLYDEMKKKYSKKCKSAVGWENRFILMFSKFRLLDSKVGRFQGRRLNELKIDFI